MFKSVREVSAVGMLPLSWLLNRLMLCRLVRAPRFGIDPVNWLELSPSAVKRRQIAVARSVRSEIDGHSLFVRCLRGAVLSHPPIFVVW